MIAANDRELIDTQWNVNEEVSRWINKFGT